MCATQPLRTCVGCRSVRPKSELLRVVRAESGETLVDQGGRRPGRGAYVCPRVDCLNLALRRKALDRALKTVVSAETAVRLAEEVAVNGESNTA